MYAKRPFAGPAQVIRYLGRYTHRGPIANSRLLSLEADRVRFRYKDYREGGRWQELEVSAEEFIRRYLLHVLPQGFVRIRYYGLYAPAHRRERLAACRALLEPEPGVAEASGRKIEAAEGAEAEAAEGTPEGVKPEDRCAACRSGRLVRQAEWHAGERPPILPGRLRAGAEGQAA